MSTDDNTALFFPFQKIDITKRGKESQWNTADRTMMALMMKMQDKPMAVGMGFQREYAERYDWLARQFKDWEFTFCSSFIYYEDYD